MKKLLILSIFSIIYVALLSSTNAMQSLAESSTNPSVPAIPLLMKISLSSSNIHSNLLFVKSQGPSETEPKQLWRVETLSGLVLELMGPTFNCKIDLLKYLKQAAPYYPSLEELHVFIGLCENLTYDSVAEKRTEIRIWFKMLASRNDFFMILAKGTQLSNIFSLIGLSCKYKNMKISYLGSEKAIVLKCNTCFYVSLDQEKEITNYLVVVSYISGSNTCLTYIVKDSKFFKVQYKTAPENLYDVYRAIYTALNGNSLVWKNGYKHVLKNQVNLEKYLEKLIGDWSLPLFDWVVVDEDLFDCISFMYYHRLLIKCKIGLSQTSNIPKSYLGARANSSEYSIFLICPDNRSYQVIFSKVFDPAKGKVFLIEINQDSKKSLDPATTTGPIFDLQSEGANITSVEVDTKQFLRESAEFLWGLLKWTTYEAKLPYFFEFLSGNFFLKVQDMCIVLPISSSFQALSFVAKDDDETFLIQFCLIKKDLHTFFYAILKKSPNKHSFSYYNEKGLPMKSLDELFNSKTGLQKTTNLMTLNVIYEVKYLQALMNKPLSPILGPAIMQIFWRILSKTLETYRLDVPIDPTFIFSKILYTLSKNNFRIRLYEEKFVLIFVPSKKGSLFLKFNCMSELNFDLRPYICYANGVLLLSKEKTATCFTMFGATIAKLQAWLNSLALHSDDNLLYPLILDRFSKKIAEQLTFDDAVMFFPTLIETRSAERLYKLLQHAIRSFHDKSFVLPLYFNGFKITNVVHFMDGAITEVVFNGTYYFYLVDQTKISFVSVNDFECFPYYVLFNNGAYSFGGKVSCFDFSATFSCILEKLKNIIATRKEKTCSNFSLMTLSDLEVMLNTEATFTVNDVSTFSRFHLLLFKHFWYKSCATKMPFSLMEWKQLLSDSTKEKALILQDIMQFSVVDKKIDYSEIFDLFNFLSNPASAKIFSEFAFKVEKTKLHESFPEKFSVFQIIDKTRQIFVAIDRTILHATFSFDSIHNMIYQNEKVCQKKSNALGKQIRHFAIPCNVKSIAKTIADFFDSASDNHDFETYMAYVENSSIKANKKILFIDSQISSFYNGIFKNNVAFLEFLSEKVSQPSDLYRCISFIFEKKMSEFLNYTVRSLEFGSWYSLNQLSVDPETLFLATPSVIKSIWIKYSEEDECMVYYFDPVILKFKKIGHESFLNFQGNFYEFLLHLYSTLTVSESELNTDFVNKIFENAISDRAVIQAYNWLFIDTLCQELSQETSCGFTLQRLRIFKEEKFRRQILFWLFQQSVWVASSKQEMFFEVLDGTILFDCRIDVLKSGFELSPLRSFENLAPLIVPFPTEKSFSVSDIIKELFSCLISNFLGVKPLVLARKAPDEMKNLFEMSQNLVELKLNIFQPSSSKITNFLISCSIISKQNISYFLSLLERKQVLDAEQLQKGKPQISLASYKWIKQSLIECVFEYNGSCSVVDILVDRKSSRINDAISLGSGITAFDFFGNLKEFFGITKASDLNSLNKSTTPDSLATKAGFIGDNISNVPHQNSNNEPMKEYVGYDPLAPANNISDSYFAKNIAQNYSSNLKKNNLQKKKDLK